MLKEQKGITLVALVITVIVLLILAGVAMSMITGQEGLFERTNEAANTYKGSQENEKNQYNEIVTSFNTYYNTYGPAQNTAA